MTTIPVYCLFAGKCMLNKIFYKKNTAARPYGFTTKKKSMSTFQTILEVKTISHAVKSGILGAFCLFRQKLSFFNTLIEGYLVNLPDWFASVYKVWLHVRFKTKIWQKKNAACTTRRWSPELEKDVKDYLLLLMLLKAHWLPFSWNRSFQTQDSSLRCLFGSSVEKSQDVRGKSRCDFRCCWTAAVSTIH